MKHGACLDMFCHWLPEGLAEKLSDRSGAPMHMFERAKAVDIMTNLDRRRALMDTFPGYRQIPSLVSPPLESLGPPQATPDLARYANEYMAEAAARHPDYFPAFVASLPLNDPDAAVQEAERAVRTLGAAGVQLFTNINGKPIDLPELMPLYECMAKLGRPIWLHPARGYERADYVSEQTSKHEIWWSIGWPYETGAAMLRLAFAGVFERWPGLGIIAHHAGGVIPMMEGRLDAGMETYGSRTPARLRDTVDSKLTERPVDAMKRFYADTATFGSKLALEAGLKFFGVDRMLFATDMPFDPEQGPRFIRETLRIVREMDLTDGEREAILCGNARKLLQIS